MVGCSSNLKRFVTILDPQSWNVWGPRHPKTSGRSTLRFFMIFQMCMKSLDIWIHLVVCIFPLICDLTWPRFPVSFYISTCLWFLYFNIMYLIVFMIWISLLIWILYCCDFATFSYLNTILLWFCCLFSFGYYFSEKVAKCMIWYDIGSIFGSIHYACPP